MEVVVTTRAIRRAKLWSSRHHQQTNTQVLTGRMPLLSPNQQCQSTLSILMAIFSDGSGLAGTKEWWRWWVVINGAVQSSKLSPSTTEQPTFTGWMPFLSPNQQCQSTEWKNITFHGLAHPKLTWGLPTLWLLTAPGYLGGGLPCFSSAL